MKPIRVFNHTLHKKLWLWVAEHSANEPSEWDGWKTIPVKDYGYWFDFACYAVDRELRKDCVSCPLDWGEAGTCWQENGLLTKWENALFTRDAKRYAWEIALLPIKECPDFVTIIL